MSKPYLQFWYEFASTYSYLSIMRIEEMANTADINIIWKPFLLGPIFKAQGWNDSPFNIYPAKGKYMCRDMERITQKRNLPFQKPSQFPRNGLLNARIACIGEEEGWCAKFNQKVFKANFVNDEDIANTDILSKILQSMNLKAQQILEN